MKPIWKEVITMKKAIIWCRQALMLIFFGIATTEDAYT
jgi:hypothetical protein